QSLVKLDVRVSDAFRDDRRVAAGDFEHLIGHVHADDLAGRPDDLRRDETNLAGPAAEIEHRLAFANIPARIAAAVILRDDFLRYDFQKLPVILDGATQFRFDGLRG